MNVRNPIVAVLSTIEALTYTSQNAFLIQQIKGIVQLLSLT